GDADITRVRLGIDRSCRLAHDDVPAARLQLQRSSGVQHADRSSGCPDVPTVARRANEHVAGARSGVEWSEDVAEVQGSAKRGDGAASVDDSELDLSRARLHARRSSDLGD